MSAGIQDSTELHKVTPRVDRLSPRNSTQTTNKQGDSTYCGQNTRYSRSECPVQDAKCYKCKRMGHYGRVCHTKPQNRPHQSPKTVPVKAINESWEQEFEDCKLEYICTYLTARAEIYQMSAVQVCRMHSHSLPGEHIRQIWVSQSPNSKIQQIDCDVDTTTGYNILVLYKAQTLFGTEWLQDEWKPWQSGLELLETAHHEPRIMDSLIA